MRLARLAIEGAELVLSSRENVCHGHAAGEFQPWVHGMGAEKEEDDEEVRRDQMGMSMRRRGVMKYRQKGRGSISREGRKSHLRHTQMQLRLSRARCQGVGGVGGSTIGLIREGPRLKAAVEGSHLDSHSQLSLIDTAPFPSTVDSSISAFVSKRELHQYTERRERGSFQTSKFRKGQVARQPLLLSRSWRGSILSISPPNLETIYTCPHCFPDGPTRDGG